MDPNNPLLPVHEADEAEMQSYGDISIVCTFGQPQAEYAAIRTRAALMDWPQRAILELTGRDRLAFLSNLVTNFTWDKTTKAGLAAGQGTYAFFLNNKGRILTDVHIIERGDRTLLELDRRKVDELHKTLDRYLFAEQVKITSCAQNLHEIALFGPGAVAILKELSATDLLPVSSFGSTEVLILGVQCVLWRDDIVGAPGYRLILPTEQVIPVWQHLAERYAQETAPGDRALRKVGWAAFNATRIEAGTPLFGVDFDETVLAVETGLFDQAVSVTKGCYLGQEIVARMHARKQIPRQIVGIRMDCDALPIAGAPVFDDKENMVGGITSSTISPVLSNAAICLGFLKKGFLAPKTSVIIPAEGAMHAGVVTPLPFYGPAKPPEE